MKDYKRLTKRAGWHKDIDLKDELGYSYIYQRLAELENAIEDGEIVRLPCKVGDTVYIDERTWTWYNSSFNRAFIKHKFFIIGKITSIRITEKQILIKVKATYRENNRYTKRDYPISAIGKTVFLSRKQIEEKENGEIV